MLTENRAEHNGALMGHVHKVFLIFCGKTLKMPPETTCPPKMPPETVAPLKMPPPNHTCAQF